MQNRTIVALVLILQLLSVAALAEVPEMLSYQGVLALDDGRLAADGVYQLRFSVHPSNQGESAAFSRLMNVTVQSGLYHVVLSGLPGELDQALAGDERYLQVTIEGGPGVTSPIPLSSRQRIGAAPYALRARVAAVAESIADASPATASDVPVGAILFSTAACPAGYEQMDGVGSAGGPAVDLGGRYLLGSDPSDEIADVPAVAQAGGTSSHLHATQTTPPPKTRADAGGGSITDGMKTHSHGFTVPATDHTPPTVALLICRRT